MICILYREIYRIMEVRDAEEFCFIISRPITRFLSKPEDLHDKFNKVGLYLNDRTRPTVYIENPTGQSCNLWIRHDSFFFFFLSGNLFI